MSDFLELCKERQSCRSFSDKPVEHEKLMSCIEAARLAPSACNAQPWSFVVVEKPELVAEVAKCGMQFGINEFLENAQAFIIILEEHAKLIRKLRTVLDSQYFAKGDIGAAAVSICYQATALGLGTLMVGMYDRPQLCELLDLPADQRFGAYIAVGYPENAAVRDKARKPLEEMVKVL